MSQDGPASGTLVAEPESERAEDVARPARRPLVVRLLPVVVALVVAAVYVVYAVWQWNTFYMRSWDLGIFTQMYQGYASGGAPIVTIKGVDYNLLGDHFHPLLIVFTPFFAIWPSPLTLLVIQALCFAVAAGIVAWAAQRRLGAVTGVVVGLAFGLSWGLQNAAESQFHEIALAVPLIAATLAAVLLEKWRWALAVGALLPFVKEDLGLTAAAIGAVMFLLGRRRDGVALAVWGVLWFGLAVFVVLPALNPDGAWAYQEMLAPADSEPTPIEWLHPQKVLTVALLAAVTAGLVFRSPVALVLLPTLAWRFLGDVEAYWSPDLHYSAVLMPVAFLSVVDGIARAKGSPSGWERWWARLAPALVAVACVGILFAKPLPLLSLNAVGLTEPDPRTETIRAVLEPIEPGSTVETDIALMNYVVGNTQVYWMGNTNPAPDYIVVGPNGGTPAEWGNAVGVGQARYPDVTYELVVEREGYSLAQRADG